MGSDGAGEDPMNSLVPKSAHRANPPQRSRDAIKSGDDSRSSTNLEGD